MKNVKRFLSALLVLILMVGLVPGALATANFTDVTEGAWYYDAVLWAVENNITSGVGNGQFAPDMACSRSQVVTFLWRSQGSPEPTGSINPFTDVSEDAWYYKAVLWAVENGVTSGTTATTFAPDMACSRSQVVTFLYRAVGAPEVTGANPFSDVTEGAWYYNPVLWAVENGVTSGTTATTFAPDMTCSRSQVVTFLYRAPEPGLRFSTQPAGGEAPYGGTWPLTVAAENGVEPYSYQWMKDGEVIDGATGTGYTASETGIYSCVVTDAEGNETESRAVQVTIPSTPPPVLVGEITVSGPSTVRVGRTTRLSATVQPDHADNKSVTWSISEGSSYARISDDGVLTGIAAGTVTVTVTAQDGSGVSAAFTVTVVEASGTWDGSGTENDPFLITCLDDLLNLQNVVEKSGYYFRQVADIDCSDAGNWIVIGDMDHPFRHHYDGGGYTISNLCFDGEATALFQFVEDSRFKNMNIVNAHSGDNHTTRENNTGKYSGNGGYTGAIAGHGTGCSFENCTAAVDFQSSNHTTGGLIGFIVLKEDQGTLMENCHVSGTITSNGHTGGLIARIWHYGYESDSAPDYDLPVKNCSADVEIKIFTVSSEQACIGGLIGEANGVWIDQCHAKGSINVINGDIGGLVGAAEQNVNITRCYAEADIHASTDSKYGGVSAGGLIGHIYSRNDVYDCYATGNISAPNVEWSPCQDSSPKNGGPWRKYYNPCGSLIGTLEVFRAYSEDQKITVYNCYATGKVDAPNICEDERVYCHGALIGLILDRYTVSNVIDKTKKDQSSWEDFSENYIGHFGDNYNLEELRTYYTPLNDYAGSNILGMQNPKYTAMPTHEYVEIITEGQLTDESVFDGWDFENVWIMTNSGPQLRP